MKVENLKNTTDNTYYCGSWIQHWENYSGQKTTICRAKGCIHTAAVGAHVKKIALLDNNWYIVPFCHLHNMLK